MDTSHTIYFKNSADMSEIASSSIDLIITSPPYPMIEMWDLLFSSLNKDIGQALQEGDGNLAFNLMHNELDKIWNETARVLKQGGFACINIGDATRTINKNFQLFPNHIKIANFFQNNGFTVLPCILWRKPNNSPTKFLGSGMLPPHALVTLEHEYILLFRKGEKKRKIEPKSEDRYNSAYFWEERNKWFSDMWVDIRGTTQNMNNSKEKKNKLRERSAAFPLKLPYRLINMFSIYGDTVLDPFWGTGTTTLGAMISARNSIGYELNSEFIEPFKRNLKEIKKTTNSFNNTRITQHIEFMKGYIKKGKEVKYKANNYNFPVVTKQEIEVLLYNIKKYSEDENKYIINYEKFEFEPQTKLIQSRLIP